MTPEKFVFALEEYWEQELDPERRIIYIRKLKRFAPEDLDAILDKVFETCKKFPAIAHFFEAAQDLGISSNGHRPHEAKATCKHCQGVGWRYVTSYHPQTGEPYESVRRCECTGLPHPKPAKDGTYAFRNGEKP